MQAFRVWSTWDNEPELDAMNSAAFEHRARAERIAEYLNERHLEKVGPGGHCRYVVREETIPRDITYNGKADRAVMVILGHDDIGTDVSGASS